MLLIGDIHGDIRRYAKLVRRYPSTIQVGDFGVGFVGDPHHVRISKLLEMYERDGLHKQHRFLRGNHDNPDLCRRSKLYLGEWGFLPEQSLFYVSGAFSVDRVWRSPGLDWWADEELSQDQFDAALEAYKQHKPRFVVTHDCPVSIYQFLCAGGTININRTSHNLQLMFDAHQPEKWYFGHHHQSKDLHTDTTLFRCLDEYESYEDSDIPDF